MDMWWRRVLIAVAVLATVPAFGKQKQDDKQKENAKIAVTSRLVNVDVVVTDKNGNPVSGLTQKDFTLTDGGRMERIDLFTAPTTAAPNAAPLDVPPDVYTNLLNAHGGVPPSVTIILLDGLNTALTDQGYARQQVLKFLSQIKPQDHVALYTLGTQLRTIHDFTTDASDLIAAISRYQNNNAAENQAPQIEPITGVASPAAIAEIAALNKYIEDSNKNSQAFFQTNRLDTTLAALNSIARHVQTLPGRKNLVWVAGTFPFCFCMTDAQALALYLSRFKENPIQKTSQLLADSNVAVYPLDARGLFGPDLGFVPGAGGPAIGLSSPVFPIPFAMEDIAKMTGGRVFQNTNDIQGAIQRVVDDARLTYVLGYYPDHKEWNGQFRKIKVKVDRPGLQVRTREGYFAVPESSRKPKDIQAAIAEIAESPLDATGIGFAVRITPFVGSSAEQITVTLHFDPHPVQFTSSNGRQNADIQYAIFELDENGKVITGTDKSAKISIPEAQYQLALKEGMGFDNTLPLLPNANELCVILLDNVTGSAGSVRIPLKKYIAAGKP